MTAEEQHNKTIQERFQCFSSMIIAVVLCEMSCSQLILIGPKQVDDYLWWAGDLFMIFI